MEIYVINKKDGFTKEQLERINKLGKVIFIEEEHDMYNAQYTKSLEPKMIVLNPDITGWKFPVDLISKIPNLKGICLQTTGFSFIDLEYTKNNNIVVTNVPNYSTQSVSEYACFLMLSVARKLPMQFKNFGAQDFISENLQRQIKGKTAGIVGLGHIGTRIAEILKEMGMNVIYWSRKSRNDNFEYTELDELFSKSDFIFPTLLINDETKKIITDELINKMKINSSFINIAGREITNHELLIEKANKNEIYGYAFEHGGDNINNYKGNIMVTSEYAWYTKEALENAIEIWTKSIEGLAIGNIVNEVK